MDRPDADRGEVHLRVDGDVATLTFDRPQARNAMTWAMYERLADHCRALAADPTVRVAVLRSANPQAFIAGTDITQFLAFTSGEDGVDYERRIDAGIALVEKLPFPTVARLEGWTVGGGLAIATACDFRLASPDARFGVPIARTLGNMLSPQNLARLRAAWGLQPLRRMLLAAEMLDARSAFDCGYLHAICDAGALDAEVAGLVDRLRGLAPVTQRCTKEALRRLVSDDVAAMDDLIRACSGSRDFREGVQAFTEKRSPAWRGE